MKLDLEKYYSIERRGTDSRKWDGTKERFGEDDLLPLWIADMDFQVADSIQKAMLNYVNEGIYGYYMVPDSYYQAFINWEKKHHGYDVKQEWICFSPGVVSGIYWIINTMTKPKDACLILTPCYYPFMNAINDNDRTLICCDLIEHNENYKIDFEKFENDIVKNDVKLFILCSPHNPVGRVWKHDELVSLMKICKKHNVFVISDEIHQDLVYGKNKHIPTATTGDYDDMLITITAGSKTFNLAGFQNSFVIIPDKKIRDKYNETASHIRITNGNGIGYVAVEAAFRGGEAWLEEVLEIINGNYEYFKDIMKKELPKVIVSPLEGTYLMWVDLGAYVEKKDMHDIVEKRSKLAVDYGEWFWPPTDEYDTHIRINIATPRKNIELAAQRLIKEIKQYANL